MLQIRLLGVYPYHYNTTWGDLYGPQFCITQYMDDPKLKLVRLKPRIIQYHAVGSL